MIVEASELALGTFDAVDKDIVSFSDSIVVAFETALGTTSISINEQKCAHPSTFEKIFKSEFFANFFHYFYLGEEANLMEK